MDISSTKELLMTRELALPDDFGAIDGDLIDDFGPCADAAFSWCPGGPAPLTADPYIADMHDGHCLTYLHGACARLRTQDI